MITVLGGLIVLAGVLWMVVSAFHEDVWWGLGSLLLPPVGVLFAMMYWDQAKPGLLAGIFGLALMGLGNSLGA